MNKQKQGFTLVELIVVITILAILGTIAFISLQGYSAQSRDSTRISDLSTMRTSLELFHLEAGKYPITSEGTDITYSGGLVWSQGTFGESVFKNVDKLDKIPTDPLVRKKYTYSVTTKRNEYQLAGITETDLAINILEDTYAGEVDAAAIIKGNYNGQTVQSLSGTTVVTCSMLAVPSIIVNNLEISTDLAQIIASGSLVYDGYNNLPASYNGSKFKLNGGFAFEPNNLLAYSDTGSCVELTNKSDSTARVELIIGLQDAYTGTLVENIGSIKRIMDLGVIELGSPTEAVENFAGSYVNNTLGGNIEIVSNTLVINGPTCEDIVTQEQVDTLNLLWSGSVNMSIYGGNRFDGRLDWDPWYDPSVDGPFTISQWCNNVYLLDGYDLSVFTPELITAYNAMEIEEVWSWGVETDIPGRLSILSQINNFCFKPSVFDVSIYSLTNLKSLYINSFGLTSIPSSIGNLINLVDISIDANALTSLPPEIGNLTNLIDLNISNNSLNSIPTWIGNLTKLRTLSSYSASLTGLPSELGNLINLDSLILHNNQLTSIPIEIGNLVNLEKLYLDTNQLTTLPIELSSLNSLSRLNISDNLMITLPPVVLNLSNLDFLDISSNNFPTFPVGLSSLTNLSYLLFGYNGTPLTISAEIGSMNSLTTLYLRNNLLSTLPIELGNLTNLITLDLRSNFGLGNLGWNFTKSSTTKTQSGMTIVGNGTTIDISGSF